MVCEVIAPAMMGMGSVLDGWPIARISAASWGDTPGWARRKSSSCRRLAPLVDAVGRRVSAITSVGMLSLSDVACGAAPYTASTAGPASTVTDVPSRPAGGSGLGELPDG